MRTVPRNRHYVSKHLITVMWPIVRYSIARDAYVLRVIGRQTGPVLKIDRRRAREQPHVERRRAVA